MSRYGPNDPGRTQLLVDPDETDENTPDDVRLYCHIAYGEAIEITQGPDLIVVLASEWERFAGEVMGAVMAARLETASAGMDQHAGTASGREPLGAGTHADPDLHPLGVAGEEQA